jgi:hypothetical protein
LEVSEYCREIETYLCRKNDGHLIRVVGPSFLVVSGWAERGVPIKVAFEGIDRYFERYYRNGPRRRPVKIDFCDADVLDVFDEWQRAVGVTSAAAARAFQASVEDDDVGGGRAAPRRGSLPEHLERIVVRLTSARAADALGSEFDAIIDAVARELDNARADAKRLRGAARDALIARLAALDVDLLARARSRLDAAGLAPLQRQADDELAPFRIGMAPDAFARARGAAVDRLVRERFRLPTIAFK